MRRVTTEGRRAAAALVAELEGLLAALVHTQAETSWLRPVAILSAEIEYTALQRAEVDAAALAETCRELRDLLTCSPSAAVGFVIRYPVARERSPSSIAALHERAVAACDALCRLNA